MASSRYKLLKITVTAQRTKDKFKSLQTVKH